MTYITLEQQSAFLEKRKAELGVIGNSCVALNPGSR